MFKNYFKIARRNLMHKKSPPTSAERLFVTDDEEFSNFFLQDLKSLGAATENVLKKVQDKLQE